MAILRKCGDKLYGAGVASVWLGVTAPTATAIKDVAAPGAGLATALGGAVIAIVTQRGDTKTFDKLQRDAEKAAKAALKESSEGKLTSFDASDEKLGDFKPAFADLADIIDHVWPQPPQLASVKMDEKAFMALIWDGLCSTAHGDPNANIRDLGPDHEAMRVIDAIFRSQVKVLLASRELRDQLNDIKLDEHGKRLVHIEQLLEELRDDLKKEQGENRKISLQNNALLRGLADQAGLDVAGLMEEAETIAQVDDFPVAEVLGLVRTVVGSHPQGPINLREEVLRSAKQVDALRGEVESLKSLANEIDGIDDALRRAQAALEKGSLVDLDAAQDALATVMAAIEKRDRQSAENKKRVAQVQAETALARRDVPAAIRHFEVMAEAAKAAEADDDAGRLAWAQARFNAANALDDHGLIFPGLDAFQAGIAAYDDVLTVGTRDTMPADWAATQNNKANTLTQLGIRAGEEEGLAYLQQSIAAYDDALTVRTRDAMPAQWATTQNNRATALQQLGIRAGGEEGLAYLQQAIAAYDDALIVTTRDAMPADWAMTQNNKAITLRNLGSRSGGEEGLAYLQQSIAAYDDALIVTTRDAMPAQWAQTQNNKANTLQQLGIRAGGEEGLAYLQQSIAAYDDALIVTTRDAMPANWAMTQNNKANALGDLGERQGGSEGRNALELAVAAYTDALTVTTRVAMPANWAMTQENIGLTWKQIAGLSDGADKRDALIKALAAFDAALTVYDPNAMPYDYGTCTAARAKAQAMLDALDSD